MPRGRYSESVAAPSYAGVRRILAPPYRNLPAEQIEALLESAGIDPEYADSFWNDVGRTLGDVGRFVAPALPAVGAAVGTAFGGPVGTALGGVAGSVVGSVLSQPAAPAAAPAPQTPRPAPRPAVQAPRPSAPRPGPAVSGLAPRPAPPAARAPQPVVTAVPAAAAAQPAAPGSPAAAQLVQTLFRPELLQALLGMALGAAANPTVAVGGTEVPLAALTNLLSQLSDQASAEYHAIAGGAGEGVPGYLEGIDDADLISPDVRAARLLALFQEADLRQAQVQRRRARRHPMEAYYAGQMSPVESDDEYYNELFMVDFYANYDF